MGIRGILFGAILNVTILNTLLPGGAFKVFLTFLFNCPLIKAVWHDPYKRKEIIKRHTFIRKSY